MKYFDIRKEDICGQEVPERGFKGRKNGGF